VAVILFSVVLLDTASPDWDDERDRDFGPGFRGNPL
jgi:hypothetical protein